MELPKNEGGSFTPCPAGTHTARCIRFVDMGSHEQTYQGESKTKRLVLLTFELPNELMEAGEDGVQRPFTISKRYTWSMHEKSNLRGDLESWRGVRFTDADFGEGGFDIKNILGIGATITVTHDEKDGKVYTNIAAIGGLMKGMTLPDQINPTIYIALQKDRFNQMDFDLLHENMQDKIKKSPEYAEIIGHPAISSTQENDPARDPAFEGAPPVTDANAYTN